MSMFVDSHADQDASVSLTRGLGLASERLAPPVEPRSIESMSPEQLSLVGEAGRAVVRPEVSDGK